MVKSNCLRVATKPERGAVRQRRRSARTLYALAKPSIKALSSYLHPLPHRRYTATGAVCGGKDSDGGGGGDLFPAAGTPVY